MSQKMTDATDAAYPEGIRDIRDGIRLICDLPRTNHRKRHRQGPEL